MILRKHGHLVYLAALGFIGIAFVLISTSKYGAFFDTDSVTYFSVAENLREGEGYTTWEGIAYIFWPPLFPTVLAFFGWGWLDPAAAGRYVDAVAFGLIIFVSGLLFARYLKPPLSLIGPVCVLVSVPLIYISTYVWSEPLFILFSLLFLLTLHVFLTKHQRKMLVLSAIFAACAWLTRYIGVIVIFCGLAVLLIQPSVSIRTKLKEAVLFFAISVAPMIPWIIRRRRIQEGVSFWDGINVTPISGHINDLLNTLAPWVSPYDVTIDTSRALLKIFATLLVGAVVVAFLLRLQNMKSTGHTITVRELYENLYKPYFFITPVLLYTVFYTAFLVLSETFTAFSRINTRLLSPAFVPALTVVLLMLEMVSRSFRQVSPRYLQTAALGLACIGVLFWASFSGRLAYRYIDRTREHGGGGIETTRHSDSQLLSYLRSRSFEDPVFTNIGQIIYFGTGIRAYELDAMLHPQLYGFGPKVEKGYCIMLEGPLPEHIASGFPLRLVAAFPEGSIYRIERLDAPPPGQQRRVVFDGSRSTDFSVRQPTASPRVPVLRVGMIDGDRWKSALAFNLSAIPANASIESATLVVHVVQPSGAMPVTVNFHQITAEWSAEKITAASQPAYDPTPEGVGFVPNGTEGEYRVTMTEFARRWVRDLSSNHGVLLRLSDAEEHVEGGYKLFGSPTIGNPVARPRLEVTFTTASQ